MELISREGVLKVFGNIHPLDHNTNAYKLNIEQLPIIESRAKGKWNHYTDDRNDYVECSECHYGDEGEVKLGYPQKMGWRFCPHCGADMRGKDEEESENKLREIAERQKQREIDEMVKQGGDRELIEYIYDKLIERVCSEMDRRLMGGTDDDTV